MIAEIKSKLQKFANPEKAKHSQRFFKTGKGQYAEGDIFLGATSPEIRKVTKDFKDLDLVDLATLLKSPIHEERLVALIIMVNQYKKSKDEKSKKQIADLYLAKRKYVNNWDLVDLSSHYILGDYLLDKPRDVLYQLANSGKLWDQRIAIMTTYKFIKNNDFDDTFKIAKILLNHEHDLIHKAVGWMIREVGKIDQKAEEEFLKKHYEKMPRTMLRYAIEKFPEDLRQKYLKGAI